MTKRVKGKKTKGSWFNGLMRPSSSQLFCVRHALTFRFAREPHRLIFHILAITLTLEALADSRLWPFHSDRAFPLQPLHLSLLTSLLLHSAPCMISPPISIHFNIKFVVRTLKSTEKMWNVGFTSVMGSLTAWPLLKGVTMWIGWGRQNRWEKVREEQSKRVREIYGAFRFRLPRKTSTFFFCRLPSWKVCSIRAWETLKSNFNLETSFHEIWNQSICPRNIKGFLTVTKSTFTLKTSFFLPFSVRGCTRE